MAQNDTNAPMTDRQHRALRTRTMVEIKELGLTKAQASGLLDEVEAGREPVVRNALLLRGGASIGPLPDPDEVGVGRRLGRTVLVLPRGVDVPPTTGKVTAELVPDGILIRVARASGLRGRRA